MQPIAYPSTVKAMFGHLRRSLGEGFADGELRAKAELAVRINELKKQKRAVILGHNYMEPALFHSVPDYTGDSLELSRIAARCAAEIIVFCGVRFMAETAKILNPTRLVLLPSERGGCSLAQSIGADDVRELRLRYPGVPVVSYVNTYAEVKAETDVCCTSGNATAVVRQLLAQQHEQIIFLPDEYLAGNVARETGMRVVSPDADRDEGQLEPSASSGSAGREPLMIAWRGRCEVHERFTVEDVYDARREFPGVVVLAHPECSPQVAAAADFTGSTTAMIRQVEKLRSGRYLLLTEVSMGENIAVRNPVAELVRRFAARCPHMGEITLEETLESLTRERHPVDVAEDVRSRARASLDRMIDIG